MAASRPADTTMMNEGSMRTLLLALDAYEAGTAGVPAGQRTLRLYGMGPRTAALVARRPGAVKDAVLCAEIDVSHRERGTTVVDWLTWAVASADGSTIYGTGVGRPC